MPRIGSVDVFEREYTEKFRARAVHYGEFVAYERDRAALDMGLQLTVRQSDASERVSPALVWFQLKGIQASTLTKTEFSQVRCVKVRLDVEHVKFWALNPVPTYLAVYVQCADEFLVLNVRKYVDSTGGIDAWLESKVATATVEIPTWSLLDEGAFQQMLLNGQLQAWAGLFRGDESHARIGLRDCEFIWRLGTMGERGASSHLELWDWQSKMRGELRFEEVAGGVTKSVFTVWGYFRANILPLQFPYLNIDGTSTEPADDGDEMPYLLWPNGSCSAGWDYFGEVIIYRAHVTLNALGERLFQSLRVLVGAGLLTIRTDSAAFLDFAPWNKRHV